MSVVDIFDFDIRCLTFDKINPVYQAKLEKEGKAIGSQYSIFAKYDGKPLSLCATIEQLIGGQTSNMNKDKKEFCDINDQQIKFTVGLNPKDSACVKLKEVIKQIEKKFSDNLESLLEDELRAKGKPFKNYISVSDIKPVKVASEEDPDIKVEVEDTEERFSKFIIKYMENFQSKRITSIFESDDTDENGEYKILNSDTRADIAKIPIFKRKVRIMFKLVRGWVSKMPSQMCGNKKGFGITFKLQRIHIFGSVEKIEKVDDGAWFKDINKPVKSIEKKKEVDETVEEEIKESNHEEETDITMEKKDNDDEEITEEQINIVDFEKPKRKTHKKK